MAGYLYHRYASDRVLMGVTFDHNGEADYFSRIQQAVYARAHCGTGNPQLLCKVGYGGACVLSQSADELPVNLFILQVYAFKMNNSVKNRPI